MNTNNPKKLADEFFSTNNEETLLKILLQFLNLLSSGDRHKKDIFLNLSDKGLNKLLSLLKANNAEVRKNSFKVINDRGEEILCDILFTFDSEETGKSYIVYTDNTKDDRGNIQVYASIYDPTAQDQKLEPITTDAEWKVIETILNTLQEEIKNKLGENSEQ